MQDEEKIFGLIAQAEDIQKHAITLQRVAQDAIKTLPDASRSAVRDAAEEFLVERAKNASKAFLSAVNEAKAAASEAKNAAGALQGTAMKICFLGLVVALALGGVGLVVMNFISRSKLQELAEMKAAIRQEEAILSELQSKTWGLELVKFKDGTRGILLPKGIKVSHSGPTQDGSGRIGIVITP